MANREIAYRVADQIEKSSTFDMAQMFHPDGQPSCIAGHVLADANHATRNHQPVVGDIHALQQRLDIDFITTMMLFQPMRPDAHIWSREGEPGHIPAKRAAAQLRRVGDGEYPAWHLPVIDGKVVEARA